MKRATLAVAVLLATLVAGPTGAAPERTAAQEAKPKQQPVLRGFAGNRAVKYFDFGRIKLRPGNTLATVWLFTNGAAGQRAVFDSVPGDKRYSALRRVRSATWAAGAEPRVLRSAAAVRSAQASGDLVVRLQSRVINAPLLGFRQTRHPGWAKGRVIHYYELGVVKVAPGNEVLPIWTFANGVKNQKNIADVVPGTTAYPPLWSVVEVTWSAGARKTLVRSFEQLERLRKAGAVSYKNLPMIVNCPFV